MFTVVAVRKGDHKFPSFLGNLVVGDRVVFQDVGRNDGHLVPQKCRAFLNWTGEQTCCTTFQTRAVCRVDGVPALGFPEMKVVDGIQIHVLRVPGERCLPHPEIKVGCVDPVDADVVVFVDKVEDRAQLVDVPFFHCRVCQRSRNVRTVDWRVEGNVLPVLAFEVFVVEVVWSFVFGTLGLLLELLHSHGFLLNVELLVVALFVLDEHSGLYSDISR